MFRDTENFNDDFKGLVGGDFSYSEFTNCDFQDCDLTRSDFLGAIFIDCDFARCVFNKALLTGVRFQSCTFHGCKFDEAYIFRSQFKNCELLKCDMQDTMITSVNFTGTEFKDVYWNGAPISSAPIIIENIEYPITILDNGYMHIACEYNTYEYFYTRDDRYVSSTEGLRTRRFWKKNKDWIFKLLEDRGLYYGQS